MAQFLVRHLDAARRPTVTRVEAADAHAVPQRLRLSPAEILSIEAEAAPTLAAPSSAPQRFALRPFAQQLAVLLRAGIPLLEALQTLNSQDTAEPARAAVLGGVIDSIQRGESFSVALARQPQAFPPLFVSVIEASERAGLIEAALDAQARYLSWTEQLRRKLVAAAVYPALLIVAGLAVVLFLLIFVVPRFAGLLEGIGGDLPWSSRLLLAVGQFSGSHPVGFLVAVAALVGAGVLAWRQGDVAARLSARLWDLPVIGPRLRLLALAQLYRCLSMQLQAGVAIVPALAQTRSVVAPRLRVGFDAAVLAVQQGQRLSAALDGAQLTTSVSLRMLRVGEQSGSLGTMLAEAAAFYDDELERLSELVTRLINPLLMLLMGLVIGTVVVLMYLPIFQLVEQVQ